MQSLEHELKKLDLSSPSQKEERSKSPETSVENAPAAESIMMSPLDHFIRDLDERKGKLPCCQEYVQEVTEIQTSVENFLKALLLEVEKDLPFFKTTLINSGSFYEGTKVGKPDEFDYFVQMDNLSQDIRFEELKHSMVAVIPSESAFEKLPKVNRSLYSFDWKVNIKSPFVEALDSKLVKGFKAFGLKVLSDEMGSLQRHKPAYTLYLKWIGGKQYKGLIIAVDLVLAVKINTHSSTMKVDFESQAGSVVSSLLGTLPYYFAVSGYKEYPVSSSSHLFKKFKEEQKERVLEFPISEPKISLREPHCLLRCSQSCLEQSLFRDHFGPDGGPSVCLRVLKVLRDMTRPFDQYDHCFCQYTLGSPLGSGKSIEEKVWEFVNTGREINSDWHRKMHSLCSATEPESTTFISSYTLKTLVLFEWTKNPEEKQWTGNNLSQRIVNIVTVLLRTLEQNKGIRSFWYKDYNVLGNPDKMGNLPAAINRVTIILKCLSSLRPASQNRFEDCVQTLTNLLTLARRKKTLTRLLHSALRDVFSDKITKVLEESVGKTKMPEESPPIPKGPYWMKWMSLEIIDRDFMSAPSVFCSIYIQALLEKLAPVEDFHILSSYFKNKDDSISVSGTDSFTKEEAEKIVKNARDVFEKNARKTMNDLDSLPDYSLWSQEFENERVASLLKLLSENFNKDLEIMHNRIRALKESRKTGNGV